jgi:tartronate-semialdehyde synthase
VFGVSDAPLLPLAVRNAESGTHAADGWARATGKVGVSIRTSGLAGTDMIAGLGAALADSVPIICITGQPAHRAVDIAAITRPVTKWAVRLDEPAQRRGSSARRRAVRARPAHAATAAGLVRLAD